MNENMALSVRLNVHFITGDEKDLLLELFDCCVSLLYDEYMCVNACNCLHMCSICSVPPGKKHINL